MLKNDSNQHKLVIVVATNTMRFPEFHFCYHPCRNTKDYSFIFAFEQEDTIISCLAISPRGSVVLINLETKKIMLMQGIFTRLDVSKEQLDDYKKQYEEIAQRINPILFEFQTLRKEEINMY